MDHPMLKELMKKKKGDEAIDPKYKSAKMGVLKDIHKMAGDAMSSDMKNMMDASSPGSPGVKKVEVAAPDKASLAEGLEKAEQLLGADDDNDDEGDEDSASPDMLAHGGDASPAEAEHGDSGLSHAEEQMLQALLEKKKSGKAIG